MVSCLAEDYFGRIGHQAINNLAFALSIALRLVCHPGLVSIHHASDSISEAWESENTFKDYEQMEEKENQHDLTLLDQELHQLIDSVSEVPYSVIPLEQPRIFFIAGSIERLIGYSTAEIYADRQLWMNIIHPDDRERVFAAFAKCKSEGAGFEVEYRISHKDGSVRCVSQKGGPVFNDEGKIIQIDGVITDVSKQKQAEDVQLPKIPKAAKP